MSMKKNDKERLAYWQSKLAEAQIDSNLPQPKVTARHKEDEELARRIEDMLRNELDRLPMEEINDMMERTIPIQGGGFYLVEWDNAISTHTTTGEISISALHPKYIIPQNGVTSSINDMDYVILRLPTTKEDIRRRYGVLVLDENESEPEIRGVGDEGEASDIVTQYIVYYRNDSGRIGMFSFVNDTVVCDYENYQSRRQKRCKKCGAVYNGSLLSLDMPSYDGTRPEIDGNIKKVKKEECPYCKSTSFEESEEDYEELLEPFTQYNGNIIGEPLSELDPELGVESIIPAKIPYYSPDVYPLIMQRNVSVFGKLLGESDADKIADQQNTLNRLSVNVIEKLILGGSILTLPPDPRISFEAKNKKILHISNPADAALIKTLDLEMDISQSLGYMQTVYKEAQQLIGITDSFLGRSDTTASSGKAKQFAAAQAAGRLESKRTMKQAAYAHLYELIFKFKLAYTDEPRPIVSTDSHGKKVYSEFCRYDFLKVDDAGEYYWNDDFLFSCDTAAGLAANREAMWQETRLNFQQGAFGDPTNIKTLILFWTKMELLHYPGAGETKAYLEEELAIQQQQQRQQMMMQQQAMQQQAQGQQAAADPMAIIKQAEMDAKAASLK